MPRVFLGIDLPDALDDELQLMAGGIPRARWQTPEQLHLTLHFLGEIDGGALRRLIDALDQQLECPAFEMQLRGAGVFPPRGEPRILWLGVADPEPLHLLHRRCAAIIDDQGLERERRKFHAHVTLARLKRAPERKVGEWVAGHSLYASAPFPVDALTVYSSLLSQRGARYQVEAELELDG